MLVGAAPTTASHSIPITTGEGPPPAEIGSAPAAAPSRAPSTSVEPSRANWPGDSSPEWPLPPSSAPRASSAGVLPRAASATPADSHPEDASAPPLPDSSAAGAPEGPRLLPVGTAVVVASATSPACRGSSDSGAVTSLPACPSRPLGVPLPSSPQPSRSSDSGAAGHPSLVPAHPGSAFGQPRPVARGVPSRVITESVLPPTDAIDPILRQCILLASTRTPRVANPLRNSLSAFTPDRLNDPLSARGAKRVSPSSHRNSESFRPSAIPLHTRGWVPLPTPAAVRWSRAPLEAPRGNRPRSQPHPSPLAPDGRPSGDDQSRGTHRHSRCAGRGGGADRLRRSTRRLYPAGRTSAPRSPSGLRALRIRLRLSRRSGPPLPPGSEPARNLTPPGVHTSPRSTGNQVPQCPWALPASHATADQAWTITSGTGPHRAPPAHGGAPTPAMCGHCAAHEAHSATLTISQPYLARATLDLERSVGGVREGLDVGTDSPRLPSDRPDLSPPIRLLVEVTADRWTTMSGGRSFQSEAPRPHPREVGLLRFTGNRTVTRPGTRPSAGRLNVSHPAHSAPRPRVRVPHVGAAASQGKAQRTAPVPRETPASPIWPSGARPAQNLDSPTSNSACRPSRARCQLDCSPPPTKVHTLATRSALLTAPSHRPAASLASSRRANPPPKPAPGHGFPLIPPPCADTIDDLGPPPAHRPASTDPLAPVTSRRLPTAGSSARAPGHAYAAVRTS